jgi:hypothetical protein
VYAHWKGKTLGEERAQITGHSLAHGYVGYLRESYDGEPYALKFLVPEAFERDAEIPAARLRARLAEVLRIAQSDRPPSTTVRSTMRPLKRR